LAYENLGYVMLRTVEPFESLEFLKTAIVKFPQNGKLMAALALAYYQNEDYDVAEKIARKAYQLEPSPQSRLILETIIKGGKTAF